MFYCIYYRQVVLHLKPWGTIYAVIWIGYETHGYLLQFYLHIALTSLDMVSILFKKKGFWIDTDRNNYPTSSQSIRYGRSTLFFCELEW